MVNRGLPDMVRVLDRASGAAEFERRTGVKPEVWAAQMVAARKLSEREAKKQSMWLLECYGSAEAERERRRLGLGGT
jgi:hypothetical protein